MNKIRFYTIDEEYIKELQKIDFRVPNTTYSTNAKFLCGIVLKIGRLNYYAPVSSSINKDNILKMAKSIYKKSLIKDTWLSNNTVDFKKLEKYALDIIQENQNKLLSDNNNQAPDIKIINPQIKM